MAKKIASHSSLTKKVLAIFLDELRNSLKIGMSVKLGEFGTMRLSIKRESVE